MFFKGSKSKKNKPSLINYEVKKEGVCNPLEQVKPITKGASWICESCGYRNRKNATTCAGCSKSI